MKLYISCLDRTSPETTRYGKISRMLRVLTFGLITGLVTNAMAFGAAPTNPGSAKTRPSISVADSVVREWNHIAYTTIGPAPGPMVGTRFMTITQLAVFEAVNAITGKYQPYLGTVTAPPGASAEAAAVVAAHNVLVEYFPAQALSLNMSRDTSLAAIPDGQSKDDGIAVGAAAASAMIMNRLNDGSSPPMFHMPTNSDPYEWQTYGGCPAGGGAFRHWQNVTPFAIQSSSQFRSVPPPALQTGVYAQAFNELQTFGDLNSTQRPQDRTDVARIYAVSVPPTLWNSVLLQIISGQEGEITDTARVMALMNMAINDAAVSVFETKYFYRTWRPITAIPRGDEDGNKWTTAGPFTPLVGTPCFPSYPSAHGSLSGSALRLLEREYGRFGHSISIQHASVPGVVLEYSDLRDILSDISDARVYGGIHFRFDQTAGEKQGHDVAQYVYNHTLRKAAGQH